MEGAAGALLPVSSNDKDLRWPCEPAFSDLNVTIAAVRAFAASCKSKCRLPYHARHLTPGLELTDL